VWVTVLLIAWLGLNAVFVAWRFCVTAHHNLRVEADVVGIRRSSITGRHRLGIVTVDR
jgi:hypothetical protein